jgi:type IV pilus assembly protein PilM
MHTERAIALVDVGAGRTSVNVLLAGETCFSREIPLGGMDMTQAIARRLSVEAEDAEVLKRDSDGPSAEVEAAMLTVIEDLAAEISLSIDYVEHHRGVQVTELLVSGGGLLVPGAVQQLERAVGRPAHLWSPLEGLRINSERVDMEDLERWASSLVVALGLAGKVAA